MARRGRFGRSDTGTSNLSQLIRSLIQQQQAQEEQALLNAFYNGTDYNGSVPTMSDISSFYNKIISDSGIDPSSAEYKLLQQKIGDANNFDIKREFNKLISDFNLNGGSNYDSVMSFLEGRAKSTTNQNDLQDFEKAIGDVASAYVSFLSIKLDNARISIEDYRSTVGAALGKMDPNSEAYINAMTSFKTSEWNAEQKHQQSLLDRKKITYSQYLSWAQDFKKTVSGTGIPMQSLMDVVDTSIYNIKQRAAAAAAAAAVKAGKATSVSAETQILDLYAIAASSGIVPVDNVTLNKLAKGDPFTMTDVVSNPEVIAAYIRRAKMDPSIISPDLQRSGLTSGEYLDQYYNSKLTDVHAANLKVYAITGNKSDLEAAQLTNKLYLFSGAASGIDELADAATQFATDLQKANGDDFAIAAAIKEWNKYLDPLKDPQNRTGGTSKYGTLADPTSLVPKEYSQERAIIMSYLNNTIKTLAGFIPGQGEMTFEGAMNITISDGSVDTNIQDLYDAGSVVAAQVNLSHLLAGTAAQQVSIDKNGNIVSQTVDIPAINAQGKIGTSSIQADSGRLNQIAFREIDGKLRPYVQSVVSSNQIVVPTGVDVAGNPKMEVWGYKYIMKNGEEIYVSSSDGKTYSENPFKSALGITGDKSGSLAPVGDYSISDAVSSSNGIPALDSSSILNYLGDNPSPKAIRDIVQSLQTEWLDPRLHPEMATMLQVVGSNTDGVSITISELSKKADVIEYRGLIRDAYAAGISGNTDVSREINAQIMDLKNRITPGSVPQEVVDANNQYRNFISNPAYKDYYIETEPGVYVLKQQYQDQNRNAAIQSFGTIGTIAAGVGAGALQGGALGAPSGPGAIVTTILGGIAGGGLAALANQGIANPYENYISPPTIIDTRTTKPWNQPQATGPQNYGYAGTSNPFFANMPIQQPQVYQPYAPKSLASASVINPINVKSAVPKTKADAQSLIAATPFNPSDPEERRALVQLESTLPSDTGVVPGPRYVAK